MALLKGGPMHGWGWPLRNADSASLTFPGCVDLPFGAVADAMYERQGDGTFAFRVLL